MKNIKQKPRLHASWIDPKAKEIVSLLQKAGFTTYLVGGCVRDLLAGVHPKDFDIATNAEPQQVRRKVWNSYIIGRRFRLVLAKRGDQQYEIATFRRDGNVSDISPDETVAETTPQTEQFNPESTSTATATETTEPEKEFVGDNFFGTPEQDALRRDFTINALFYDPIKDELIDYSNGMADIETRTLRVIGEPTARILEDPIRSFRAIRLAHKINFKIEENLRSAISEQAGSVTNTVLPRRREEYLKFLRLPETTLAWLEMFDLGLIQYALPSLYPVFESKERLEIFLYYLLNINKISPELNDPVDIYTPFIYGVIQAMNEHPDKDHLLQKLMRDELMIFKAEQAQIFARIELAQNLNIIENFQRRGFRRQQAFVRNENFSSALRLAAFEKFLSAKDHSFWLEAIEKFK